MSIGSVGRNRLFLQLFRSKIQVFSHHTPLLPVQRVILRRL